MGKRAVLTISVAAVVCMCAFIFIMSAFPADESTELSMGVVWRIIGFIVPGYDEMSAADQLYWQKMLEHPVRKIAHFTEFMALGSLMLNMIWRIAEAQSPRAQMPRLRTLAIGAWACATAYAVTDEIHQIFVPGRACMFTDVLIDSAGVLVGVAIVAAVIRASRKRREAPKRS